MLPQFLDWGFLTDNFAKVTLDVKSKIESERRTKMILIAVGAVAAGLFVLLIAKKGK
jgi:hypothetical protein